MPRGKKSQRNRDLRERDAHARTFRRSAHESPITFAAFRSATVAAGLRALGQALLLKRDLLGEASQAHGELSAFNAGRSQLPLRGSSGIGLTAAPDSLLGLPFG
jgi:hypothetical protein